MVLKINRDFSLDKFEQALTLIAKGESRLQLPHSIKANAAGAETALLQLIITWARVAEEQSTLRLYSNVQDIDNQRTFAQTTFGLVALNLAQSIEDLSGEPLDRYDLLALARDYVISMAERPISALRQFDKTSIPFICVDNARKYRRPSRLYIPGTDQVRDRSDFASLIKACVNQLPLNRRTGLERILEGSASLLFEAFQNTHEHAQTDYLGNVLRRSVRGFTISFRYVGLDTIQNAFGASPELEKYYHGWKPDTAEARFAQFLEFGVFDSGPGLARRWLSTHQELASRLPEGRDLDTEYEAVINCLAKGATTKSSQTSGNGLFRIMQAVKQTGGFIRIRTGNLSLIKAFDDRAAPFLPEDLMLVDLESEKHAFQRRSWAEGTTISVLLPMNRAMTS